MAFDEMNLFDFFGGFGEEEDLEAKRSKKSPAKSASKKTSDDSDYTSNDLTDDSDEEDEEDNGLSVEESKTSTSEMKPASKKSKEKKTKELKVALPVTCVGRNFRVTIEDSSKSSMTHPEIYKHLFELGYKEVAHRDVNLIIGKDNILYFTSPRTSSKENNSVGFNPTITHLYVANGMEIMELEPSDFDGLDPDEVSVSDVLSKWEASFPQYEAQGLSVDTRAMVACPVYSKAVSEGTVITLPCKVIFAGQTVEFTENDFILEEGKPTAKKIMDEVAGETGVNMCLYEGEKNVYYIEFTPASKDIIHVSKESFLANKNGVDKEATLKMSLPLDVYFATINQNLTLTSEQFDGKTKVTEEEVKKFMGKSYSVLRSSDRKLETFYLKERNLLSIALTSGKKGAAEHAAPSLFKMSDLTLEEAIERETFLGLIKRDMDTFRVEVNPVGAWWGKVGSDGIENVDFKLKLPKIPIKILYEIAKDFYSHMEIERIAQIVWDKSTESYVVNFPSDSVERKALIMYEFAPLPSNQCLVMTIHSHNTFAPYFSKVDDADEIITGIYGVLGSFNESGNFSSSFRVGMEGVFSYRPYDTFFVSAEEYRKGVYFEKEPSVWKEKSTESR